MMKKILSGSSEFWENESTDTDYIVFDPNQIETFKYYKKDGNCYFSYKPMSKKEYFDWHMNENNWYLNTAPLVTVDFLKYMKINPFGADKKIVHELFDKMFRLIYCNIPAKDWNKYSYRLYIYTCYMINGSYELTEEQLSNALKLKRQEQVDESVLNSIYEFFGMGGANGGR